MSDVSMQGSQNLWNRFVGALRSKKTLDPVNKETRKLVTSLFKELNKGSDRPLKAQVKQLKIAYKKTLAAYKISPCDAEKVEKRSSDIQAQIEKIKAFILLTKEGLAASGTVSDKLGDLNVFLEKEAAIARDEGLEIHADYGDAGKSTVKTFRSVDMVLGSLRAKRQYLNGKKKPVKEIESEIARLQGIGEREGVSWVTADRYRDAIVDRASGFSTESAEERYIPAPVNMREQSFKGGDSSFTFLRYGALTDPRNGTTNLRALRQEGVESSSRQEALELQMLQVVQRQLDSNMGRLSEDGTMKKLWDGGHFCVAHTGLLDPKVNKNKNGFVQREENMMLDTAEIFKMFEGRDVVFETGLDGPFLDDDGRVHLQWKGEGEAPEGKTLHTTFSNISVQGYKKNTGHMYMVNVEAFESLQRHIGLLDKAGVDTTQFYRRLGDIEEKTQSGKNLGYELANEITMLERDLGMAGGTGCFSAKDRGGYAMALLEKKACSRSLKKHYENKWFGGVRKWLDMRRIKSSLMSKMGIATRIVFQNTSHEVLKVRKLNLIGVGIIGRLGMFWAAGKAKS